MTPEETQTLQRICHRAKDSYIGRMSLLAQGCLNKAEPNRSSSQNEALKSFHTEATSEAFNFFRSINSDVLMFVRESSIQLTEQAIDSVVSTCERAIDAKSMANAFTKFESSLERRLRSYGTATNLERFRPNLSRATYTASVINGSRKSLSALRDDLNVMLYAQSNIKIEPARAADGIPWWRSFDKRIAVLGVVVAVIATIVSVL